MGRLLFDEAGNLAGVDSSILTDSSKEKAGNLMKSENLSFLKHEKTSAMQDSPFWSLHENGTSLNPLLYSNGKTQEDIVKETVNLIKSGKKVIFIHGVCGTGKSSIALNLARLLGKAAIIVPFKGLQKQYEDDYTKKKYVLKPNGLKMRIAVITGRDNHDSIIFPGVSCASPNLPDNILITEKNRDKLIKYYHQNPFIQNKVVPEIRKLRRISIAPSNPYWSPIRLADYDLVQLSDARRRKYRGVNGMQYVFYHRKQGCSYYDQFQAYIDADVIIFNSAKYEVEMAIGRKPETEIDIIDEADAFLDNFSKEDSINLTRLLFSLQNLYPDFEQADYALKKLRELIENEIKNKNSVGIDENKIFPLQNTFTGRAVKLLLESSALQAEILIDESNYANKVLEVACLFEDLFDDAYVTYHKYEDDIYVNLVTTNVSKRFAELSSKTKVLVLMSGTLHSEEVLKNVFGISDFAVINAEIKTPGRIDIIHTGAEMNCEYKNLIAGKHKRKEYLLALSLSLKYARSPSLVHVNSFEDLPSSSEIEEYGITNLISRESLKSAQFEDKNGEMISKFKSKIINVLFSTKCSRGVDFPGDICNSVIFTKYPNPNTQDIFWKILKRTHLKYFWKIYQDKARREFFQRIYRALRSPADHVYLFSPDSRVLDAAKLLLNNVSNNQGVIASK